MSGAATGRMGIVRMAEIVVGAVEGLAAADEIADAAGAVEGPVAVGATADAAGRAGEDTKPLATDFRGFSWIRKRPRREPWSFCRNGELVSRTAWRFQR